MIDPTAISLDVQIAAVNREIGQRERVYPRLVEAGRMSQRMADEQTAAMKAVALTLATLKAGERLL